MSEMCCTRLAENTERKKLPSGHHRTTLSSYIFESKACIDNRKKLLNSNISSTCSPQHGELRLRSVGEFWAPQHIWTGFASWRRYCTDVAQRRSTQLCRMFYRLLGWYVIYTFLGALVP